MKKRKSEKVNLLIKPHAHMLHKYMHLGGSSDEKEINEEMRRNGNGMILEEDEEVRYEAEEDDVDDYCGEDEEEASSDEVDVAREERFTQETVYSTV